MTRICFRTLFWGLFVWLVSSGVDVLAQRLDAFTVSSSGEYNRVWYNDGTGYFADSEQVLDYLGDARTISLGDLDGDGDLDAFIGYRSYNTVLLNDGTGNFTEMEQELGESNSVSVGLGDLDSDGDLDAFVANWGAPNRVWFNDGAANFTDSGVEYGAEEDSRSVALGDLDGDGDLDAVVIDVNVVPSSKVFFNDGAGFFTDAGQDHGSYSNFAFCVALGDLDGDGDLDAFLSCIDDRPNVVLFNDGAGTLIDVAQYLGGYRSTFVVLGDLDADGDLDAFVANTEDDCDGANQVFLNDGNGVFADSGQYLGSNPTIWLGLGDLDEDGDLDVFEANRGSSGSPDQVWFNDGTGIFFNSGQRLENTRTAAVALGALRNPDEFKTHRRVSHVADPDGIFGTTVILVNDTNKPQSYKLTPRDGSGEPLPAATGTVLPHSVSYASLEALFGGARVSHFDISEQTGVQVRVAYQTVDGSPATIRESSQESRRWRVMPGNWDLVFDGLALVNTGPLPAEIRLRQVNEDGGVIASAVLPEALGPGAKTLVVLDEVFSSAAQAHVEVLSTQPLAVTAVQGTKNAPRIVWQGEADPVF